MRKIIVLGLTVLGLMVLAGCNKQPAFGQPGVQPGEAGKVERNFVHEDFFLGGGSEVLRTEKGYYYLKGTDIRYKDFATGNDMYLCNKPECRHDGNEFCVATNDTYVIHEMRLYNGKLFAVATEMTETQCMFKLLVIEPDGSAMDELVTYMTMELAGQVPTRLGEFQIHRNRVMLPFAAIDVQNFSDTDAYGTALYNLDTKELTYLDEEPFCKENSTAFSIQGYKDWIFYCKSEEGKTKLHRYSLTSGTDEAYTLLPSFAGIYGIKDENTIVYIKCDGNGKTGNEFCVYHVDTGENEIAENLKKTERLILDDGTVREDEVMYGAIQMTMDESYIYVFEREAQRPGWNDPVTGAYESLYESYIHIYDHDLKKLTEINFGDAVTDILPELDEYYVSDEETYTYLYKQPALCFLNGEAYCFVSGNTKEEIVYFVYRCKQRDLLAGEPVLELVYSTSVPISN